ncbi:MAG: response regulator [Ignavibacteriales bacterium]
MEIRVVIVDDHSMVREGLKTMLTLEDTVKVVGEAGTMEDALKVCGQTRPDVVLLDIKMPNCTGYDFIGPIRKSAPQSKILMLTAYDDKEYVRQSFEAGADGYALKSITRQELVRAIESVNRGQGFIDPAVSKKVISGIIQRAGSPSQASLTSREREILSLMAAGNTNLQIAKGLYLSPNTVKTHVTFIIRKLGATSRTDAVARAISQGLVQYVPQ